MAGGLNGRSALVTGAAGGIGRAIAARLVDEGARVLAVDVRFDGAAGAGGVPGGAAPAAGDARPAGDEPPAGEPFAADLTDPDANAAAVREAIARFGALDILVPAAGVQHVAPIAEFPVDRWRSMLDLMLTSPFLLARAAWPALADSDAGRFIAIASAHALTASPYKAAYVSAKHGLLGLVRTLALEGAPDRICATAVCPGYVRTPLVEAQIADQAQAHGLAAERVLEEVILAPHAIRELIEPGEVADVVAFLAGPGGRSFTGVPVTMDMGWTAR